MAIAFNKASLSLGQNLLLLPLPRRETKYGLQYDQKKLRSGKFPIGAIHTVPDIN